MPDAGAKPQKAPAPAGRQPLVRLVEGHYLSQVIEFLHSEGILRTLDVVRTVEALAAERGLDVLLLRLALTFVAERSDLLEETREGFVRSQKYGGGRGEWVLDQYLGAYGPVVRNVGGVLQEPARGAELVNGTRHARAYAALERPAYRALPVVIRELQPSGLVDLGCGAGTLLRDLAREREMLRGWGLDANPEMCRVARERLARDGLAERVTILEGAVGELGSTIPKEATDAADVVVCASLLNQRCADGAAISWLSEIRQVFQDRVLVVADYYGRLGSGIPTPGSLALMHDLVQALSGQGVPPADREGWGQIYSQAGCQLMHAFEGEDAAPWFIHLVRL